MRKMDHFVKTEITDKELRHLNAFLTAEHKDAHPLTFTQTHGFLCAIASAPCLIMHSKYQPVLLGGYPEFQSVEQAKKIFAILGSFYNNINEMLREDKHITPLLWKANNFVDYDKAPLEMVEEWCEGYLLAVGLDPTWRSDEEALPLLAPFHMLATDDDVLAMEPDENNHFIDDVPAHKQSLKKDLPEAIKKIFDHWKEARKNPKCIRADGPPPEMLHQEKPVKNIPKIGRNEPCFCGSGIKFKKCCGSPERIMN